MTFVVYFLNAVSIVAAPPVRKPLEAGKKSTPDFVPGRIYTQSDLIDLALTGNPSTRALWRQSKAAAASIGEARAAYFPQAKFRIQAGSDQWYTPAATGPDNFRREQMTVLLSLEYILLDFGRRSAGVDKAIAIYEAADLAFERDLQSVVYNVHSAYFAYLAARARLESAESLLKSAGIAEETIEKEKQTGLSAKPEQDRVKAELARAKYEHERAAADAIKLLGAVCVAAGLPANTPLRIAKVDPPKSFGPLITQADVLIDQALASRPDLLARAAEVRAKEAATRQARADFFPEIKLEGRYAYSAFGYDARDGETHGSYREGINGYGAFVVASWDIFDGFERLERERRAREESEVARHQLGQAQLDATAQVWDAFQDNLAAAIKVRYAEALVESAAENFRSIEAAMKTGLAPVLEYSEAAANLAVAKSTFAGAVCDYSTSLALLRLAAGSLPPPASAAAARR